jgi:lysozyme
MTLEERIINHEGFKLKKYRDSLKNWTIYCGHLCKPGELYLGTKEDAMKYLRQDIEIAKHDLKQIFPFYKKFTRARQEVLIELLFNMGMPRFLTFIHMIHAINISDWEEAAKQLRQSKWYGQVDKTADDGKGRGDELIEMLREG